LPDAAERTTQRCGDGGGLKSGAQPLFARLPSAPEPRQPLARAAEADP
jgi:hypothetical protein